MWIEIFRSGKHTDSNGRKVEYSQADIADIATKYNSSVGSDASAMAPLVKGHPETDSPALGWIYKLKAEGDSLYADATGIDSELISEIRQGRYRNVSISLTESKALRHVGILGAAKPAVKGMEPLRFIEYSPITSDSQNESNISGVSTPASVDDENALLKKKIKELTGQLDRRDTINRFSEKIDELPSLAEAKDMDKLLLKLADIDDEETAEQILDAIAVIAEGFKRDSGKQTKNFAELIKPELDLGMENSQTSAYKDFNDREATDRLVKETINKNPAMSYEEVLNSLGK
jgi:hypothetical protein